MKKLFFYDLITLLTLLQSNFRPVFFTRLPQIVDACCHGAFMGAAFSFTSRHLFIGSRCWFCMCMCAFQTYMISADLHVKMIWHECGTSLSLLRDRYSLYCIPLCTALFGFCRCILIRMRFGSLYICWLFLFSVFDIFCRTS